MRSDLHFVEKYVLDSDILILCINPARPADNFID